MFFPMSASQDASVEYNQLNIKICDFFLLGAFGCFLTWGTQETPFSMFLTIRKRFLKNAKISPCNARPPTHTLGVDKGNQQYEQLLAISRESQLTIQNLESGMERLKNDLEGEVNNSEKLNIALSVSKALVNNLNTKYAEAVEKVNLSAKTSVNLDTTSKALKKAKEEVARLTNKNEESQKVITKLRENLRFSFPEQEHNKLLQEKYHLENKLQEADQKASLAEDEVFTYVEKNTKLSELNTKLMIALNNSKGSQDALVKQISVNASSTSSHLLPGAKGSTPKPLSKKELKKLRQKTKKRLVNMQAKEAEDISGDDDDLNNSVEDLIDSVKNSLDLNDNFEDDSTNNNNVDPSDISDVSTDVREDPSNASTDVLAEEHSIATDLLPPPSAIPEQYDPHADGLAGVPTKDSRNVNDVNREVFTKQLAAIVSRQLERSLKDWTEPTPPHKFNNYPPNILLKMRFSKGVANTLKQNLDDWRTKGDCSEIVYFRRHYCSPCDDAKWTGGSKEPCISQTGAGLLFRQMTEDQVGNICKLFTQVFSDSVCTVTKSELGKELWNLTPPWGVLGLGYSLRDFSFNNSNYSSHHALGTLADQLVRRGMLDAATAGGEDHRKDGETDQQHQAVEAKPE